MKASTRVGGLNTRLSITQANQATKKNLSDDREAMKQSIRGLRETIEQLVGERERAERDSLEHTRHWQERAEELKAQGLHVSGFRASGLTPLSQDRHATVGW